ncbi:MAG TPA: hypothetical protein VIJ94_15140 [Caulobacteraceae bacterium]
MRAQFRADFDPEASFVVRQAMRLSGSELAPGSDFPKAAVTTRRLRQLFDSRLIAYPGEDGRDLAKPPAPRRHGFFDQFRRKTDPRVSARPAGEPRRAPHLPTSLTQPAALATLQRADVPNEFDDGDLEPVLSHNRVTDGPTLAELVAAEGRVARAEIVDPDRPGAHVQIPEDWTSLTWPKLLSLASNFSIARIMNKPGATEAITAELARRARTS